MKTMIILLAVYVIVESLLAICAMPKGWGGLCCKAKYASSLGCGVAMIAFVIHETLTENTLWLLLLLAGTLGLFVWPRMVWRLRNCLADMEKYHDYL